MKKLIYGIYAFLFNLSARLFKLDENTVALVSMHNENFNDSLGQIYSYLKKENKYRFVFISRTDLEMRARNIPKVLSFFFIKSRLLAQSKYVFLNDNFLPMAKLNFKKDAVITQLWHGEGVFKKFGFAIEQDETTRKNEIAANSKLSHVVCTSKNVVPYYAQAFDVDKERVLPLGSPRTDFFFEEGNEEKAKDRLYSVYPNLKGKKLVLYAPTFRDNEKSDSEIIERFNAERLLSLLGEDYAIAVRLHPQVHFFGGEIAGAVNVTDYDDVRQLVLCSDVLVTDYSSICMDFSLLNKKTVFFAFDKESYTEKRNFYFPYDDYVPGKVVCTTEQIAEEIKAPLDTDRNERFKKFNFDFFDGKSAERVVKSVMKGERQ